MKVLAILLVIGVSWVAARPGLLDWQDNAEEEESVGEKNGLLGPVKGILGNVNSWGSKLIPAPILDKENLGKLDVLNLRHKRGDDEIVKEAKSPLANILGKDNLVGSLISSAVGSIKEGVLGGVVDKLKGGIGGGKGGKKLISSRKSSNQKSSELSEKEAESEKESSESNKSESILHEVSKAVKIDEKVTEESESEAKEKSSGKETEEKSAEESSVVEEAEKIED